MIYLASSWRNEFHSLMLRHLRSAGHKVYNFKDEYGFHWSEIDAAYKAWDVHEYTRSLSSAEAVRGFDRDYSAMVVSTACVLLLPCGRSAHLEAGWFVGQNKPCAIFIPPRAFDEPELMYKMADDVFCDTNDLLEWAAKADPHDNV